MKIGTMKNFPLAKEVRTVEDVVDILIALKVISYDTKINMTADEKLLNDHARP